MLGAAARLSCSHTGRASNLRLVGNRLKFITHKSRHSFAPGRARRLLPRTRRYANYLWKQQFSAPAVSMELPPSADTGGGGGGGREEWRNGACSYARRWQSATDKRPRGSRVWRGRRRWQWRLKRAAMRVIAGQIGNALWASRMQGGRERRSEQKVERVPARSLLRLIGANRFSFRLV